MPCRRGYAGRYDCLGIQLVNEMRMFTYGQVAAPSGNREQRFSVHASRPGQTADRKWGAAAEQFQRRELQGPQNIFQHSRASNQRPRTPATGLDWRTAASRTAAGVSNKYDFSMPNWSSSSDDNSPRTRKRAPATATYQFNLSDSD